MGAGAPHSDDLGPEHQKSKPGVSVCAGQAVAQLPPWVAVSVTPSLSENQAVYLDKRSQLTQARSFETMRKVQMGW